ncbi:MAG: phospho-N-acetylmuramoyl-pentapeptide-transferase [Eubacteriales bacterium]|nr:phospho-N-acetylmuramoyl-pentapeptide-transferase [Eubacteriales bacterium]
MQQYVLAALLAFAVALLLGPVIIPALKRMKFGQTERDDGPQSHLVKSGTPTMGGIMILAGILAGTLAFYIDGVEFALPALLVTFVCGLLGFLDDFIKVRKKRSLGLKAYQKIIGQFCIALIVALYAYNSPYVGPVLLFPFTGAQWDMGIYYIPFVMFVVIAIVNAVNLTDGLDGLASGVTLVYAVSMCVIFIVMGQLAETLGQVYYSANLNGMSVFTASVAGACLGFLRYNSYPARVFMGDTGSLALGGAISMMAIFSRSVFLFLVMGACFVASAVSVVLQVGSYKLRNKKRIFKMAPLHHHFELCGIPETKIVASYMIVTTVLCLVCLLAYL